MVQARKDALTGADRDAVLINETDAAALGLRDGDAVRLANEQGELRGRVLIAPIKRRNLQIYWPEGNVLIDPRRRSPGAGVPDYNAFVRIDRLDVAADNAHVAAD
jgi:anaerobic selenocysteine-containing dehydrogenase